MKAFPYVRRIPSDQAGYALFIHEDGMDLLDYIAIAAMQASRSRGTAYYTTWDDLASDSYDIAEAMIKEREKRNVNQPT